MVSKLTSKINVKAALLILAGLMLIGSLGTMASTIMLNSKVSRANDVALAGDTSEDADATESSTTGRRNNRTRATELPDDLGDLMDDKGLFGRAPDSVAGTNFHGIIGAKALLNNQWVAEGESSGGAKLLEIMSASRIAVEIDGNRREIQVSDANGGNADSRGRTSRTTTRGRTTSTTSRTSTLDAATRRRFEDFAEAARNGQAFDMGDGVHVIQATSGDGDERQNMMRGMGGMGGNRDRGGGGMSSFSFGGAGGNGTVQIQSFTSRGNDGGGNQRRNRGGGGRRGGRGGGRI